MKKLKFYLFLLSIPFLFVSCNYNSENPIATDNTIKSGDAIPTISYTLNLVILQSADKYVNIVNRTFTTSTWEYSTWQSFNTYSWPNSTFTATLTFTWSGDSDPCHVARFVVSNSKLDEYISCGPQSSGTKTLTRTLNLSSGSTYSSNLGTDIIPWIPPNKK